MSILDTFYLLFDADASKLDKGLSASEKKAKGLVQTIGTVDAAAGKLGGSLMESLAGFAGAAIAAVSLAAMSRAMFDAAGQADKLNESAERLGLNIETLSAWGDAIKKNGGSVEGFIGSIEGLNTQLQQMEVTGKSRAAPFLKELGIDLDNAANKGKNAMDFLPQIADAFAGMDKQKSVALGKRLGFDQATIMTLQSGRREVEAMIEKEKELGVITKKQGEIADAFGDQMDDTKHAFRSVWLGVSEYVLPPLTWMMEKFQHVAQFMRKHSDFIVGLMIALGAAVTFYALPPLIAMASAVVVAFAPFIMAGALVAALATGFALLYDDIMAFIDGGESMIGHVIAWAQSFPLLNAAVGFVGEALKFLVRTVSTFIEQSPLIQGVFSGMAAAADLVGAPLKIIWELLKGIGAIVGKVFGAISSGIEGAKGLLGAGVNVTTEALIKGKAQLGQASASPLASQTSNSINSSRGGKNTSVNIGTVEVKTQATDAAGISKAIGGSMQTQMRQAVNNYDDGVLA